MDHFARVVASPEDLLEVYPLIIIQTKDYLAQATTCKHLLVDILRLQTTILLKLPASFLEDRRYRKEIYVCIF